MKTQSAVTTLFLDIGDVLLSNGWGHESRHRAAKKFKLDIPEMEARHRLVFVNYEEGKLTLHEYLRRVVFYVKRAFTETQFRDFMFAQTTAHQGMIDLMIALKARHQLKIVVLSNEARELNEFRIHKFKLNAFVDFYISSCFVHIRKPDSAIFRMALDMAQVKAEQVVYIDNTKLFTEVAADAGMIGIHHKNIAATKKALSLMGLK